METHPADAVAFPEPCAAYVHVPFCARRCGYCDFTLVAGKDHLADDYLRALEIELSGLQSPRPVETLFLGGGTPTHLAAPELRRLLELMRHSFVLSDNYEFSVEANPAGFGREKIELLAEYGVNRVSLGAQSFDVEILTTLERDHRDADIECSVELLRKRIPNFSLDFIFGVPGQSLDLWRETLRRGIALGPTHISTYGLTFEKGTAFWSRRTKGELVPAPEELERDMYAAAMDDLASAGFEQYELSNFARPGFRCRHNGVYWAGLPYYGFGPGAARYIGGKRETNHRSVTTWLARVLASKSPVGESEQLSPEARAREAIVLGLRRCEGIDRESFRGLTGYSLDKLAGKVIAKYVAAGLLEDTGASIRLTRDGKFLADSVIVDFL